MDMTLRLTDDEAKALQRQAEREGRSTQDVARQAVRDYIEGAGRRELLERVLDEDLPRYAEALRRLGAPPPTASARGRHAPSRGERSLPPGDAPGREG